MLAHLGPAGALLRDGGGGGEGDASDLALSGLELALVREVLSLLLHLSDLLGAVASALLSLLLLLHPLGLSERFLHSLTLALFFDVLELLAAGLELAVLHLTPVVFLIPALALLEVPLALIESLSLDPLAALLS